MLHCLNNENCYLNNKSKQAFLTSMNIVKSLFEYMYNRYKHSPECE